jgi:purine nucleosidase
LRARWKKIVCTPTDISVKAQMTGAIVKQIEAAGTPIARYVSKFAMLTPGADIMWDEIAAAAWVDPSIVTRSEIRYMSVETDHGAAYGNTLTWSTKDASHPNVQRVEIQFDLDAQKFYNTFVKLVTAATPH